METDLKQKLVKDLEQVKSLQDLEQVKYQYVGRKGVLRVEMQKLATLSPEEKRAEGERLNALNITLQDLIVEKEQTLHSSESEVLLQKQAETLTFTKPKVGHLHPLTLTIRMLNQIFVSMGYSVMEGPELETDEYCFQRLNVPQDHPARDMQDTLYIEEPTYLLRTQTSSIEARILEGYQPPLKVVIPGRVYRNEKVNKSNHFIFHHYQGVVVQEKVSLKDLFGTFTHLFKKMYGDDVVIRFRNKYYPEVEPGVGPDMQCFNCKGKGCTICKNIGWIEMGGAGIIHPHILDMAGVDRKKYMGFAFALGLDRWVMAKYNITDIRSLLSANLAYKYYENENTL